MNSSPMTRKTNTCCALCESSNLASICVPCVNYRLNEYNTNLKSLNNRRDALYSRLSEVLVAKGKADDQKSLMVFQNEKLARMREKLRLRKEELIQGKAKIEKMSRDLKVKYELLESARSVLGKNQVEQLEKFFPNLICTQNLGYMAITSERLYKQSVIVKQLCKLFPLRRGSCSRIWQRDSYWDARPSSRSEYPLFIPRPTFCNIGEASWSDKSSSNFGVASMESVRKPHLESSGSFNSSSASPHSIETHRELQKGISLLKKSVACITAYCYNSLCLEVPAEASTFEAFARLLATLSSSKEMRSVFSLKMVSSRSSKQVQQLNKTLCNVDSAVSSSNLIESAHAFPAMRNEFDNNIPSSAASFLYPVESSDAGKNENFVEGWDLVEHPTFPPPPSQTEDVEHWTRAMFIDATKK